MDSFMGGFGLGIFITATGHMSPDWTSWILPAVGAAMIVMSFFAPDFPPQPQQKRKRRMVKNG